MPSQGELRALFKVVQDTSVKKVIDNVKGEVAGIGQSLDAVNKKLGGNIFTGMSESFKKLNPQLAAAFQNSGTNAGKNFAEGFRRYTMADLPKIFSKVGPALPDISQFLPKDKDKAIKGLREVIGKDLAKVQGLPDINDLSKKIDHLKLVFAGIATLYNPFVGARLLSDAIPKGHYLKGGEGGGGIGGAIFGAAGAGGYGEIFVVIKAVETAFKLLVGAIKKVITAYDEATKIYAKSLVSGLSVGFSVKRASLADVLGVDEKEVVRFGAALAYLTPQLAFANEEITKTTIPLTGVGWQFKILGQNIKAIWAQIAEALSPAFKELLADFNAFLVALGRSDVLKAAAGILNVVMVALGDVVGLIEIAVSTVTTGLKLIVDGFAILIAKILNSIPTHPFGTYDVGALEADAKKAASAYGNLIKEFAKNFFGGTTKDIPPPISQIKQLPAGAFEKMGLVIGGGMANKALEYQRRTATAVEKLLQAATAKNNKTTGYFMNRNPFVAGY